MARRGGHTPNFSKPFGQDNHGPGQHPAPSEPAPASPSSGHGQQPASPSPEPGHTSPAGSSHQPDSTPPVDTGGDTSKWDKLSGLGDGISGTGQAVSGAGQIMNGAGLVSGDEELSGYGNMVMGAGSITTGAGSGVQGAGGWGKASAPAQQQGAPTEQAPVTGERGLGSPPVAGERGFGGAPPAGGAPAPGNQGRRDGLENAATTASGLGVMAPAAAGPGGTAAPAGPGPVAPEGMGAGIGRSPAEGGVVPPGGTEPAGTTAPSFAPTNTLNDQTAAHDGKLDELTRAAGEEGPNVVGHDIGGLGDAADIAATVTDPLGAVLSAGVGWLFDHISFLREPIDKLVGDSGAVQRTVDELRQVAQHLDELAQTHSRDLQTTRSQWTGPASDAFSASMRQFVNELQTLSKSAHAAGDVTSKSGGLVSAMHKIVKKEISTLIAQLIEGAIPAAIAMPFTCGASEAIYIGVAVARAAAKAAQLAAKIAKLAEALARMGQRFDTITDIMQLLSTSVDRFNSPDSSGAAPQSTPGGGQGGPRTAGPGGPAANSVPAGFTPNPGSGQEAGFEGAPMQGPGPRVEGTPVQGSVFEGAPMMGPGPRVGDAPMQGPGAEGSPMMSPSIGVNKPAASPPDASGGEQHDAEPPGVGEAAPGSGGDQPPSSPAQPVSAHYTPHIPGGEDVPPAGGDQSTPDGAGGGTGQLPDAASRPDVAPATHQSAPPAPGPMNYTPHIPGDPVGSDGGSGVPPVAPGPEQPSGYHYTPHIPRPDPSADSTPPPSDGATAVASAHPDAIGAQGGGHPAFHADTPIGGGTGHPGGPGASFGGSPGSGAPEPGASAPGPGSHGSLNPGAQSSAAPGSQSGGAPPGSGPGSGPGPGRSGGMAGGMPMGGMGAGQGGGGDQERQGNSLTPRSGDLFAVQDEHLPPPVIGERPPKKQS